MSCVFFFPYRNTAGLMSASCSAAQLPLLVIVRSAASFDAAVEEGGLEDVLGWARLGDNRAIFEGAVH